MITRYFFVIGFLAIPNLESTNPNLAISILIFKRFCQRSIALSYFKAFSISIYPSFFDKMKIGGMLAPLFWTWRYILVVGWKVGFNLVIGVIHKPCGHGLISILLHMFYLLKMVHKFRRGSKISKNLSTWFMYDPIGVWGICYLYFTFEIDISSSSNPLKQSYSFRG